VVVLIRVLREEIGAVGVAIIVINTAREEAEIGLALKIPSLALRLGPQRDGIAEAKDLAVSGMKSRPISVFRFFGHHTTQFAGVSIHIAAPGTLPGTFKLSRLDRLMRGGLPIVIEAGATAESYEE